MMSYNALTERKNSLAYVPRPTVKSVKDYGSYQFIKSADLPLQLPDGRVNTFGFDFFQFAGGRYTVIYAGDIANSENPLLRINSRCVWGDFGSLQCDCGWQFKEAKRRIADEGLGLIIYCHDHVGKGIGIREHHLLNGEASRRSISDIFYDAYLALGFKLDYRDFGDAAAILKHYGIRRVRLMTNNPDKIKALGEADVFVERVPIVVPLDEYNRTEMLVKRDKVHHWIDASD
jgi:3,4-dihydroxy 2-butanone 4-phosphate synthase / GTP cyclohydrolase II